MLGIQHERRVNKLDEEGVGGRVGGGGEEKNRREKQLSSLAAVLLYTHDSLAGFHKALHNATDRASRSEEEREREGF